MLFQDITIIDGELRVKEHAYVGIKGDKIDYIGTEPPEADYGEVYSGKDRLLMSGFFNAHAHTPMTLLRGYGENLKLSEWLNTRIFPFEDRLNDEDVYYATLLGMAESLRFGIVSSSDMYYHCDHMAKAILESGAKCNLGRSTSCFTDEDLWDLRAFREAVALFKDYNGAGDGRVKIDMSIHAEYTCTEKVMGQMAEYATEIGAGLQIHASESAEEVAGCRERHGGMSPIEFLNELGAFAGRCVLGHGVWLDLEDMEILKGKDVTIASCPVSNLKLASGVCNVPALMEKGINVALGTDSVSSNNSLNIIEEMKIYALVHKGWRGDPTVITPEETLYAATAAGAKSQGRADTGALKEGMKADLIVLDISGPHMCPVHNLLNNLVYSASGSDVVLTVVDGKTLYKDGEFLTIDIEKVKFETERSRVRILGELEK